MGLGRCRLRAFARARAGVRAYSCERVRACVHVSASSVRLVPEASKVQYVVSCCSSKITKEFCAHYALAFDDASMQKSKFGRSVQPRAMDLVRCDVARVRLWAFDATDSESDRFCTGGQVDKGARPSDDDDDDDDEAEEEEEAEGRQVRAAIHALNPH